MRARKVLNYQRPANIPENWEIHNAPRPLLGHEDWTSDFISGIFYAALNPDGEYYQDKLDYNIRMAATRIETITPEAVIEEMVQYYKVERPKVWEELDIDLNDPETEKALIQTWFNLGKHIVEEG